MEDGLLSVVVPVYNAPKILPVLYQRIVAALTPWIDFEIIFVNDACPAGSEEEILKLIPQDTRVKYLKLARNYGQHIAISAGLDYASGNYAVVMDCDLQDQPEDIKKLYDARAEGNYDVVLGVRAKRKDKFLKRVLAVVYRKIYRSLSHEHITYNHANFSIITRDVIMAYRQFREQKRSYSELLKCLTDNIAFIDVAHAPRYEGKSSYSFSKYFKLGINYILFSSGKPLVFSMYAAILLFLFAAIFGVTLVWDYFVNSSVLAGWTSLMVIICFFSGLQMLFIGILGAYVGAIFDEAKNRPLYTLRGTVNIERPFIAEEWKKTW